QGERLKRYVPIFPFFRLREGFDLATPAGWLMAGVLASVAAYETEDSTERQLAGIARARVECKRWGGRVPISRPSHPLIYPKSTLSILRTLSSACNETVTFNSGVLIRTGSWSVPDSVNS